MYSRLCSSLHEEFNTLWLVFVFFAFFSQNSYIHSLKLIWHLIALLVLLYICHIWICAFRCTVNSMLVLLLQAPFNNWAASNCETNIKACQQGHMHHWRMPNELRFKVRSFVLQWAEGTNNMNYKSKPAYPVRFSQCSIMNLWFLL